MKKWKQSLRKVAILSLTAATLLGPAAPGSSAAGSCPVVLAVAGFNVMADPSKGQPGAGQKASLGQVYGDGSFGWIDRPDGTQGRVEDIGPLLFGGAFGMALNGGADGMDAQATVQLGLDFLTVMSSGMGDAVTAGVQGEIPRLMIRPVIEPTSLRSAAVLSSDGRTINNSYVTTLDQMRGDADFLLIGQTLVDTSSVNSMSQASGAGKPSAKPAASLAPGAGSAQDLGMTIIANISDVGHQTVVSTSFDGSNEQALKDFIAQFANKISARLDQCGPAGGGVSAPDTSSNVPPQTPNPTDNPASPPPDSTTSVPPSAAPKPAPTAAPEDQPPDKTDSENNVIRHVPSCGEPDSQPGASAPPLAPSVAPPGSASAASGGDLKQPFNYWLLVHYAAVTQASGDITGSKLSGHGEKQWVESFPQHPTDEEMNRLKSEADLRNSLESDTQTATSGIANNETWVRIPLSIDLHGCLSGQASTTPVGEGSRGSGDVQIAAIAGSASASGCTSKIVSPARVAINVVGQRWDDGTYQFQITQLPKVTVRETCAQGQGQALGVSGDASGQPTDTETSLRWLWTEPVALKPNVRTDSIAGATQVETTADGPSDQVSHHTRVNVKEGMGIVSVTESGAAVTSFKLVDIQHLPDSL